MVVVNRTESAVSFIVAGQTVTVTPVEYERIVRLVRAHHRTKDVHIGRTYNVILGARRARYVTG